MDVSNLLQFAAVAVLLTIAPGPDILFVTAQSVTHGRKAGVVTALGLCSGITVHTGAAAFGISAIFHQSTVAFHLLKYAGAVYLFVLAWQAIKEGRAPFSGQAAPPKKSMTTLYRRGILMNVLNPKVSLFFLALLPQFVTPEVGRVPLQMVALGLIFMIQAILIFTVVAIFAGRIGSALRRKPRRVRWINMAKAGLFALIGIRLALPD